MFLTGFIPSPPKPKKTLRGWTEEDTQELIDLYAEEPDVSILAKRLNRPTLQCLRKLVGQKVYKKQIKPAYVNKDMLARDVCMKMKIPYLPSMGNMSKDDLLKLLDLT